MAMVRINLGKDSSGRPLVVNRRTKLMLVAAERKLGCRLTIVQGSYRRGSGAAASAATHDQGGVVDIRTWDLPAAVSPQEAVRALREVGFAAWYRTKAQGFDPHIHAVALDDPELHPSAARQAASYRAGRNGLASNGRDDGWRPELIRTWEQVQPAKAPAKPTPKPPLKPAPKPVAKPPAGHLAAILADLSHHQRGPLDFVAARAAGILGVFYKCTEGMTVNDATYDVRRPLVAAAKQLWGAYHFAHPDSSGGREQAVRFLDHAKLKPGDLFPVLDLEKTGGLSRKELTAWVGEFVTGCKRRHGGCIIYLSRQIPLDDTFGCPLYVPRYSNANTPPTPLPAPWRSWTIWQFSDGVHGTPRSVPGLGNVDLNTIAGASPETVLESLRIGGKTPAVKPAAKPSLPVYDISNIIGQFRKPTTDLPGVRAVQEALNAWYARRGLGKRIVVDGVAGPQTKGAAREYQLGLGFRGKDADGVLGEASLRKLAAGRFRLVA